MLRIRSGIRERNLVRAKSAFNTATIDRSRSGPALVRVEYDHRPARTGPLAPKAGLFLNCLDLLHGGVERRRHRLMHVSGLVAFHKNRRPAVAAEQLL